MLLIGSRHRRDSCSEAYRFARSSCVPADPKIDLDVSGLLSWGSSIAPPSTQPSCVVTRLGRRPDFGSGLPRPDRVPLLPFLPASAVCYAASRSEDPLVRRSAGLLHPAADHGVRHVSDSLTRPRSRASDPKVVDPKVHPGIVPCGEDPSKRSPPRQPSTMPSPRLVLSDAVAFTGWRSLSPFERARFRVTTARCTALDLRAFFHRGVRCVRATLPSRDRSMLPWALDRLVPTLPRVSRCPALAGRFAWRPEPLRRPLTRT